MNSRIILVVLIFLLLVCTVIAAEQGGEGPPGDTGSTPAGNGFTGNELQEDIQAGIGGGTPNTQLSASTPLGDLNIPAGSQVKVSDGTLTSTKLSSASTSSNINVIDCSSATIAKNGRFTANSCDYLSVGPLRFKNVKNIVATANSITFSSAESGSSTNPTFTQYPPLGQSAFTIADNTLLTSDLTFSTTIPFSFPNPLAFDSGKFNSFSPIDSDNDGLSDDVEERLGTNIHSKDSDADSLTDKEEFLLYATNGTNAHTFSGTQSINPEFTTDGEFIVWANSNFDRISGTLRVAFEHANVSAPTVWRDSDGDGVSDFKETIYFATNAKNPDTDNDGWTDGEELANNWNPKDVNSPGQLNYNQIQCKDCVVAVRPQVGGTLHVDFSNYSSNAAGSKIAYQFTKTELAIQSNNILSSTAKDVNTFTINDSAQSASIFLEKQQNFYQTTTQNIVSRLDGFKILEPQTLEADFYEILGGSNVRYLWHPVEGVVETELSSPGLYQYQFKTNWMTGPYSFYTKSWGQSFSIHRPQIVGLGTATLIFDKSSRPVSREQFEQTYAKNSVEVSYISFFNHQLKLKGVLTYSRPQVQVLGILPLADAYQEGTTVAADITYREDNIISVSPTIATGVNLPVGDVGFDRISPTSGRLLFKVPASLVKVEGNPDVYAPVWKSNDPLLTAEIGLDSTNILATLSVHDSITNGQRYDVWFDDTHLYGGVERNVPYRFAGFARGSGALADFNIGNTVAEKNSFDPKSPVVVHAVENVTFLSQQDGASLLLNKTITDYFVASDRNTCATFDTSALAKKDLSKTILGFLASIAPIVIFIPQRRKGQISGIILIAVIVIFITIAAVYLSPSWKDVMTNTVLKVTNVESDSASTKEYAENCYAKASQCWLQRAGLNNGYLTYQPSGARIVEGERYIAAAGADCVDAYDFNGRAFNIKTAKAAVHLGLNEKDTSATVSQTIQLKFLGASSTAREFFTTKPVRFGKISSIADMAQTTSSLRDNLRDVNLLVLENAPVESTVYDLGKKVVVVLQDPTSEIVPGVGFQWMWVE